MPIPDNQPKAVPPTAEQKLDTIIKDFGDTNKTADNNPGEDLRKLLDDSPDLKKRILDSVDKGYLKSFKALPPNTGTGGSYSPTEKAINLPMDILKEANTFPEKKGELVFVMGHEIQHSFNAAATKKTTQDFLDGTTILAKSKASPHDYTKLTGDFIQASREDEASAHIGGFNAIVSQAKEKNPKATLKEIYDTAPRRMRDFISPGAPPDFNYTMKPGLTLNADMSMPYSKENVAAMGKYYFDKTAEQSKLGPNGNLDYTNFYGSWTIGVVGNREKAYQDYYHKTDKNYAAPEVHFDMKKLGLDENLIKQNVKFADNKAFSYVDTSDGKNMPKLFNPVANANIQHPENPVTYHAQWMALKSDAIDLAPTGRTSVKRTADDMNGSDQKLNTLTAFDVTHTGASSAPAKRMLLGDDSPSSRLLQSIKEPAKTEANQPGLK